MAAVSDGEQFVAYYPGDKIDVRVHIGMDIPEDDPTLIAFRSGKVLVDEVPKEAYGYSFKAIVVPIRDNNHQVIGTLNVGIDLSAQNELLAIATQLAAGFQETTASSEELAASATSLSEAQAELTKIANQAETSLRRTDEILAMIRNVASQTNLLGLNASIEAARAGEYGLGFGVVADEIRKLSNSSTTSTQNIEEILKELRELFDAVSAHAETAENISADQAAAAEEISATMQEISTVVDSLRDFARIL